MLPIVENHSVKRKPLKTSELEKFEQILQAKKPNECTDEEIKQTVRYCMLLVGIRANTINNMDEMEKMVLIEFIKTRFSKITIDEIKLAFTKAVAYELDIDPKHYENFSCEYFGRIISGYRTWAQKMHDDLYKNKQAQEEYKRLPPYEKYNSLELVDIYYKEFIEGKFNDKTASYIGYEIIADNFKNQFTDEEINEATNKAYHDSLSFYETQLSGSRGSNFYTVYKNSRDRLIALEDKLSSVDVSRKAKIHLVVKWFERLKEKGVKDILTYKPTV